MWRIRERERENVRYRKKCIILTVLVVKFGWGKWGCEERKKENTFGRKENDGNCKKTTTKDKILEVMFRSTVFSFPTSSLLLLPLRLSLQSFSTSSLLKLLCFFFIISSLPSADSHCRQQDGEKKVTISQPGGEREETKRRRCDKQGGHLYTVTHAHRVIYIQRAHTLQR